MSKFEIDYDDLVQNALRGVVKDILTTTADEGLPGDHHFYIAFRTRAPGVEIADHLRSRYPDEMTIVLQHKFWGLTVHDDHFEVGLSFHQQPEHLVIPFSAITGFVDPSVQFALQFQDHDAESETDDAGGAQIPEGGAEIESFSEHAADVAAEQTGTDQRADHPAQPDDTAASGDDDDNVVALDAFRKKT